MATADPYSQTLVVRVEGDSPLDRVLVALTDLADQRILRVTDLRLLAKDADGAVAAVSVEHIWWSRLIRALSTAKAELISELEPPKTNGRRPLDSAQLSQIVELNELRRVGTLTEAEFAVAKHMLLGRDR